MDDSDLSRPDYWQLVARLYLPVLLIGGFGLAYYLSTTDLQTDAIVLPYSLLGAILLTIFWNLFSEVKIWFDARRELAATPQPTHSVRLGSWWLQQRKAIGTMVLCGALVYGIGQVGFVVTSVPFTAAVLVALGWRSVWKTVVGTLAMVSVIYVIFVVLLQVRLPRGQLDVLSWFIG